MHAEARSICRHQCVRDVARRVEQGGWLHLCAVSAKATVRHGQLGFAVADWRRAPVQLKVWVSGQTMTLHLRDVDLSDWTRAARKLAEAVVPHVGRGPEWRAVPPECATSHNGKRALPPWGRWAEGLPHKCDTLPALDLPTSSALLAAVTRDNAFVAMRRELPAHWAREKPLLARARFRAAMQSFDRQRAAWEADEVVRRAISPLSREKKDFRVEPPRFLHDPPGAPTDSYTRYTGMTAPLGGYRMHARLHKIRSRLDRLQKQLEKDASQSIAAKIAQERSRLMHQWPLSGSQVVALETAKERHALAVAGAAHRLAHARRSRRAKVGRSGLAASV